MPRHEPSPTPKPRATHHNTRPRHHQTHHNTRPRHNTDPVQPQTPAPPDPGTTPDPSQRQTTTTSIPEVTQPQAPPDHHKSDPTRCTPGTTRPPHVRPGATQARHHLRPWHHARPKHHVRPKHHARFGRAGNLTPTALRPSAGYITICLFCANGSPWAGGPETGRQKDCGRLPPHFGGVTVHVNLPASQNARFVGNVPRGCAMRPGGRAWMGWLCDATTGVGRGWGGCGMGRGR
jgi:hypothetical protein